MRPKNFLCLKLAKKNWRNKYFVYSLYVNFFRDSNLFISYILVLLNIIWKYNIAICKN